jgi:WD40 repeat protein
VLLLAVTGGTIVWGLRGEDAKDEPAAKGRPFAQRGQDDCHGPTWAAACSRDGTRVAAGTMWGDVWLKDGADGRSTCLQEGSPGRFSRFARCLAFSPDGRDLAVAGQEPAVRIWGVESRVEREALQVGGEATKAVAFAPDGAVLAVGQERDGRGIGLVTLWDYARRRRLAVLEGHGGGVNTLAFAPDGAVLAAGDTAGVVRLWDVRGLRPRATLQTDHCCVVAVCFSPDGATLATANALRPLVQLWDAASGAPRGEIATGSAVNALAASPDGTMLVTAEADGTAALWEAAGLRRLATVRDGSEGGSFQSLAFSGDGTWFVTGGADGALRVWDVAQALAGRALAGG